MALSYLHRLDDETHYHGWLAKEQAGFHLGHHIEDHQLLLTYLLLAASHHRGPLALAFIDLEKAYDRIPRTTLWRVLAEELEVVADIWTRVEALYYYTRSVVWAGGSVSAAFDVNMGVKQGCPASPRVFCLFFNRVWDFIAAHAPPSHHAHTPFLPLLISFMFLYADDVVLIAESPEWL